MKNKLFYFVVFFLLLAVLSSCKKKIYADFSYEPEQPRIGETVTFTNLSDGGEVFDWTFTNLKTGSLTRSVLENPTRVFTSPGDYSVVLRVDSNNNFVRTKTLYVFDSVPNISRDKEEVGYYENITFKPIAYNYFNRATTYEWLFSKNAGGKSLTDTIIDGFDFKVSHDTMPVVYFTQKHVEETVMLRMTIGDSVYTIQQIPADKFIVQDVAARSLLMARKGGNILRQRIFENGVDEIEDTGVPAGHNPYNIISYDEQVFIFDAGTYVEENTNWESDSRGDGSIRVMNLNNDTYANVISNTGLSSYFGFYNGYVDSDNIYWTDRNDFVYQTPKTSRNLTFEWKGDDQYEVPYYVTRVDSLGYFGNGLEKGQLNGGIYFYNGVYFWAKGGTGKGIYRFRKEDVGSGQIPNLGSILDKYSIRAFAYDRIKEQVYFSVTAPAESVGFWVADINGKNERLIEAAPMDDPLNYITGIVIDTEKDIVYWSYNSASEPDKSGIKQIKRIFSNIEKPGDVDYFNKEKDIYGIALDNVPKYGIE